MQCETFNVAKSAFVPDVHVFCTKSAHFDGPVRRARKKDHQEGLIVLVLNVQCTIILRFAKTKMPFAHFQQEMPRTKKQPKFAKITFVSF